MNILSIETGLAVDRSSGFQTRCYGPVFLYFNDGTDFAYIERYFVPV